MMNRAIPRRLLASLLTSTALVAGLGACGGGDKPRPKPRPAKPSATPSGISDAEVNQLPLNTPRSVVAQRFGKPVDPTKGLVPAQMLQREPKGATCSYYTIKGGKPRDFARLCFQRGKLASKLSLVTPQG